MPRGTLILVVLVCLAIGLCVVKVAARREPQYHGRTLSEWLDAYQHGRFSGPSSAESREAAEAVRHIGTNALPFLVKWISCETPAWGSKLYAAFFKLAPSSRQNPFVRSVLTKIEKDQVGQVLSGFDILGAQAGPAVPDLARLMVNTRSPWVIIALSHVGKDGLPVLISGLSDPRQTDRWRVVSAIGAIRNLPPNDQTAVPVLVKHLSDPNPAVATAAAQSLGSLTLQPELAVPALIKVFKDPKSQLRVASALALGKFGEQARPAVPALLEAQTDPDHVVRAVAINTLRDIAPEAWENARKSEGAADNVSGNGQKP